MKIILYGFQRRNILLTTVEKLREETLAFFPLKAKTGESMLCDLLINKNEAGIRKKLHRR